MTEDKPNTRDQRPSIPLHFVSGLPGSGKSSLIKQLLAHAQNGECIGVIQSVSNPAAMDSTAYLEHRIEKILTTSCVCCEIFLLFYEKMLSLLNGKALDCIMVELSHEADIAQLKSMLVSTPLHERIHWGKTLISFDVRDRRFRPYAVMPAVNRMIDQADALIVRYSDLAHDHDFAHLQKHRLPDKNYYRVEQGADPIDLRQFLAAAH